jgi:hypothetical protein
MNERKLMDVLTWQTNDKLKMQSKRRRTTWGRTECLRSAGSADAILRANKILHDRMGDWVGGWVGRMGATYGRCLTDDVCA